MRIIQIFTKPGCQFCDAVQIPEGLNAFKIDVTDVHYEGHIPPNLPAIQIVTEGSDTPLQANGSDFINNLLNVLKETQDGVYKQ